MRLLVSSGLVAKSPNRSYRVCAFDDRDLYELGTLRLQLEQLASRLAFEDAAFVEGMESAIGQMKDAVRRRDKLGAFDANNRFHEAIIGAAGHRRLSEAYGSIADQIEFAFLSHGRLERDIDHLVGEHEMLLDLARSGELEAFLNELQRHVQGGLELATGMKIPDISVATKPDIAIAAPQALPKPLAEKAVADIEMLGW